MLNRNLTMMGRVKLVTPARLLLFLALGVCGCTLCAFAQSAPADFPVLFDGKTVIIIHHGYGDFTPAARAHGISARLKTVAEDPEIPLNIKLQPSPAAIEVRCGNVILASVFTSDAQAENTTREALAQQWSNSFLVSMRGHREKYGWRQVVIHSILAVLAIVFCVLLLIFVRLYTPRFTPAINTFLENRVKSKRFHIASRLSSSLLSALVTRTLALIRLLLLLTIATLSIHTLLVLFPATRSLAVQIYGGIVGPAHTFFSSLWTDVPAILFTLILATFTWYCIRLIRYFFRKVSEGAISIEGFRPAWSTVTARLISIAVVVLAALVAYPYIPGSQSPAFKGVSLFLGVLVSLGSTGLVANIITGVMLTYMDAFEPGDLVRIGDITAYIKSTSLLTTRLVTRNNEIITMPNSFILNKHIINYTSHHEGEDSILINAAIGMGYDVPWRQVEAMLLEAAARTTCVVKDPAPFVIVLPFDVYTVNYEVNAYLKPDVRTYIGVTELNHNVLDVFNEYGVSIMTPAYRADPVQPKVVARDNWFAAPANPQQTPRPPIRKYPPSRL